jgi:hypothetical protein
MDLGGSIGADIICHASRKKKKNKI